MNPRGLFLAALISVIEAHIQYSESLRTLLDRPAAERTSVSQVLVPFMDNCDSMVGMFPDDTFPDFSLQAVLDFSKPCREVQLLYERGSGGACADIPDLPSKAESIHSACCQQNGQNFCTREGQGPTSCDAMCAKEFLPYFKKCMSTSPSAHGLTAEMNAFIQVNDACANHLPKEEVARILVEVQDQVADPSCHVDTSGIMTLTAAKQITGAPCEEDKLPICEASIAAGVSSCKMSYCQFCGPDAHLCDKTCAFPCEGAGAGGPPPPPALGAACATDSLPICEVSIAGGAATCADTFCADGSCEEPHACDKTCGFPCAAGGGHRLLDEEEEAASAFAATQATLTQSAIGRGCPWDGFDDRFYEAAAACCPDGGGCALGMPTDCAFSCGSGPDPPGAVKRP